MKFLTLAFIIIFSSISHGQQVVDASITRLFSQDKQYIQLSTYFIGNAIPHDTLPDTTYQANVLLTLLFSQNGDIVNAEKYAVSSPKSHVISDFEFNQKISLPIGKYNIELIAETKGTEIFRGNIDFEIEEVEDYRVSDILPIAAFQSDKESHGALNLQGHAVNYLPFNFVHRNINILNYYVEFHIPNYYGTLLRAESLFKIENNETFKIGSKYKKIIHQENQSIYPVFSQWDLSEQNSGDYYLKIDLIDENKLVLASSYYSFSNSNPEADINEIENNLTYDYLDSLDNQQIEYISKATQIIIPSSEVPMVNTLLKNKDYRSLKSYLYTFWARKDPIEPFHKMSEYISMANTLENEFSSGFRHGFETDRGRIMLRYGKPNDILKREQDMTSVPYEIWIYNKIERTGETNVRFVFYNPSLVSNDMELIHSTAIGEIKNYNWERLIYSDATNEFDGPNHIDAQRMKSNINRNARRLYDNN